MKLYKRNLIQLVLRKIIQNSKLKNLKETLKKVKMYQYLNQILLEKSANDDEFIKALKSEIERLKI